ncbi:MAG TPA: hypothetical protein VJ892_04785, partial [Candidatus Absconditabacterales bacterium]|nr:hypothetical protein [Candidatus Absconditabacterales bacterium]
QKYFDKLQAYADEPSEFIGKNIWYDDLIANKQYFYKEALNSYVNGFIFAEDIGYRRYTDLMVKLMQESHNDMIADILSGVDGMEELQSATDEMNTPTMSLEKMVKDGYIKSYSNLIGGTQLDNIVKNVETANRWIESYSGSNDSTKNRTALDTHYLKMEQKDETLLRLDGGLDPLIISFNEALEDIVNEKIEEEKYWLNEVIPLSYLKYDGFEKFPNINSTCTWKEYEAYENYFFGMNADRINSMEQTSTYKGTYRNYEEIDNLTVEDIQNSEHPSTDISDIISLNNKSIGGSYDIFATQVDANRGYNISNTVKELEIYELNKIAKREYWNTKCEKKFLGICWKKRKREPEEGNDDHLCNPGVEEEVGGCETPAEFGIRNWGGASPLNLSGMNERASGYNFQDAIYPIYDIAGSKSIGSPEYPANSFKGAGEYTRLIQKKFVPNEMKFWNKNKKEEEPDKYGIGYRDEMGEDIKFTNWMPIGDLDNPNREYNQPILIDDVDYFSKYDNSATWEGDIIKISKEYDDICVGNGEIFTYKTLDSRVKNNLSTKTEINGTSYKVFEDEESPVKKFYDGILTKIDGANDQVQYQIENFDINNQDGIIYNMNKLGEDIEEIESSINEILFYSVSSISSLSNQERQNLATQRKKAFDEDDIEKIEKNIETIKEQMLDLDGFADSFSFDYIQDYINEQIYVFEVNQWNLIFLNTWKQTILSELTQIKNKFNSIANMIDDLESEYNNIGELNKLFLETELISKK